MKTILIWMFTVAVTVMASASYFIPDLVNLVAAYGVFMILLGLFCIIFLFLMFVLYEENNPEPKLVEVFQKIKDNVSNPVKRFIDALNKLVVTVALIYHGWVFTGVMFGLVLWVTHLQFKSVRKMELPEVEKQ